MTPIPILSRVGSDFGFGKRTAAAAAPAAVYQVQRSLRFNSADTPNLIRTPASAGNRKTWTWSGWVKRGKNTGSYQVLLWVEISFNDLTFIAFNGSDQLSVYVDDPSFTGIREVLTAGVFRDFSAWYHLVFACDTTLSTSTDRVKIYVNGVRQTLTGNYPDQNSDTYFNSTNQHTIGYRPYNNTAQLDAYLAEVHFIDGQALAPSDFAETNASTGQWVPKEFTGTYGTQGWKLNFSDNSGTTATTLGKDTSGNGRNWTPANFSVTAGVGNDSLVDTPTSYGTSTGVGGEVRGNYATLNPLVVTSTTTLSNGNLDVTSSGQLNAVSTVVPSTGKWYWEITLGTIVSNSFIGLYGTTPLNSSYVVWGINGYGFLSSGFGSPSSTVSGTGVAGDVIGLAFDVDAKTLQYYKNGSSMGTISGFTFPANWSFGISCNATVSSPWSFNFGARAFSYTAPSGFSPLVDTLLPEGSITTSGTFTGNANADGPFVYLNGVPTAMTINGNAVTFGTHADKLSNGFKLRTSSASYNTSGSNTYSITTTGDKFKNARAQTNP